MVAGFLIYMHVSLGNPRDDRNLQGFHDGSQTSFRRSNGGGSAPRGATRTATPPADLRAIADIVRMEQVDQGASALTCSTATITGNHAAPKIFRCIVSAPVASIQQHHSAAHTTMPFRTVTILGCGEIAPSHHLPAPAKSV